MKGEVNTAQVKKHKEVFIGYCCLWLLGYLAWRSGGRNEAFACPLLLSTLLVFVPFFAVVAKLCWSIPRELQDGSRSFTRRASSPSLLKAEVMDGLAVLLVFAVFIAIIFAVGNHRAAPVKGNLFAIFAMAATTSTMALAAVYCFRTLQWGWRNQELKTRFGTARKSGHVFSYWLALLFLGAIDLFLFILATIGLLVTISIAMT